MNTQDLLRRHGACAEARDWAKPHRTLAEAWATCPRGDWMLWLASRAGLCSRQQLVAAACECARLALPHVPEGEPRPLAAIEAAECWARGEEAAVDVRPYAAAAAAYAVDAARRETLLRCAEIVRERAAREVWAI